MVLSELRKRQRDANLVAWLGAVPESSLHLSLVTVGEIEKGIAGVAGRDAAFARHLERWLDTLLRGFANRIVGIDTSTARRWGRLAAAHGQAGADLLIAATALGHGLTVVTGNLRPFLGTGVDVLDPFASASGGP